MPSISEVLAENLIPPQQRAAEDPTREVLCLACAGSGKSRTLAFRIARLVANGEDPLSIVAFTFTEKAAESIKRQVAKALKVAGLEPMVVGNMYIGTIHSFCKEILCKMDARYRQFDVLDDNKLKLYLLSRYYQLGLKELKEERRVGKFETIKQVSEAWKIMNDEMVGIRLVMARDPMLGNILDDLRIHLDRDEFIDFSLMIRLVVEALQGNEEGAVRSISNLKHLMVDEYQDTNPSQELLIQELHSRSSTLFVVGDDDQAIYSWRGAHVGYILEFRDRYPNCSTHTLSRNFRSTPAIVRAADSMAAGELGATRITKNPFAEQPEGPRDFRKLWFNDREEESEWVAERIEALLGTAYYEQEANGQSKIRGLTPGDFAILMRSTREQENDGSPRHAAFTRSLNFRNIRFSLEAGGSIFDRNQVQALRDSFNLLRDKNPSREEARSLFDSIICPAFPESNFSDFVNVIAHWGRQIHGPITRGSPRRRVFPQKLVHELLNSFGIQRSNFPSEVMQDIGKFSKIIQDVESVYLSIDTRTRFRELIDFLYHVAETGYDTSTDDLFSRPDAVTVSTIHKVKGLEFPVVFVVDMEARRFPGDKRSYSKWLPVQVIDNALRRGAYQRTNSEEARLFYTAITRAERYLYVTGSTRLPGGKASRKRSPFWLRLSDPEISENQEELPNELVPYEPIARIDDVRIPTTYSEIKYYLCCPRDYQLRKLFGFSPPIGEMLGFGASVHTIICKLHEQYEWQIPTAEEARNLALRTFHLKHVPRSNNPESNPGPYENAERKASEIASNYVGRYSDDFAQSRQLEVKFEIPVEQALISGSIDLLFKEDPDGKILSATVIDFKTMEGGEKPIENDDLHWTELALQVQLYAAAANEILGENARTGAVHLLRDNRRVDISVTEDAINAAIGNIEWAVNRIISEDFPMRPSKQKCDKCDFAIICSKEPQQFSSGETPLPIQIEERNTKMIRVFSEFEGE